MKPVQVIIGAIVLGAAAVASAQVYAPDHQVNGYYRQNGTYVQPYHATNPDGNPYNNYSTQGNVNPYTGQMGHRNPNPNNL
jgi:hypothetical protein